MNKDEKETMTAILCQNERLKWQLRKVMEDNARLYAENKRLKKSAVRLWNDEMKTFELLER